MTNVECNANKMIQTKVPSFFRTAHKLIVSLELTSTQIMTGESVSGLLVVVGSLGTLWLWEPASFSSEAAVFSFLLPFSRSSAVIGSSMDSTDPLWPSAAKPEANKRIE